MRLYSRAAGALAVAALATAPVIGAVEYHVDRASDNLVRFISDAPIEDFEGVTDRIDGYSLLPEGAFKQDTDYKASELYFEVDLASLDTGIGLRNRHMRENYLHTDKFPYATYSGRVMSVTRGQGDIYRVVSEGQMNIHGVSRALKVEGTFTEHGDRLVVECAFEVNLEDYDIEVPSLMFLKINEIIELDLRFSLIKVEKGDK